MSEALSSHVDELPRIQRENPHEDAAFHNCNFRVLAQYVAITEIDLSSRSFSVFTELSLAPLHPELRQVCLNLGSDAKLPNELSKGVGGRVTVNDEDADYFRKDSLKSLAKISERCLDQLTEQMYDELVDSEGELVIDIPESCYIPMDEQQVIKVAVDIRVINPKHGIHFFCPSTPEDKNEADTHIYTYRSNVFSSTPQWLPCLNTPDQLCMWRIEATVEIAFTFIASGELMDTEFTSDMKGKVYHYQLMIPTSATNVGFVIGHFTPVVFPDAPEITNFALPSLYPLVKHTTTTVDRIFEFFEELLSCRFPFPSYKQVFVAQAPEDVISYTGLSILSISLLYHKKILDMVQMTRQSFALAVAQQFFGCFVTTTSWLDVWLVSSLARFITGIYIERYFGTSEYLYQIKKILNQVCDYESRWGKIVLRPASVNFQKNVHFDPRNPCTCSPLYADAMFKKGQLIMRMLSLRLGKESFIQVIQKVLSVAMQCSHQQTEPSSWMHMTVSTESFFRTVSNVTGHELPTFLEQWINGGGHAKFLVLFSFNRKRNMIELEVIQRAASRCGRQVYVGPLTVVVQELDGSFTHTVQIDTDRTKHDLQCHSKGRRQKKKKIPLSTGEEIEIDLGNMDPDSPVLWIRVDPELMLVRKMNIRQPVYQWEYMLKYERSILSQLYALEILQRFPSPHVRSILIETVESENFFYRVRCRAAFTLSTVVNKLPETWHGPPTLMILFKRLYGCKSAPHIPKQNNFVATSSNLQQYFLMHALPQALAQLRSPSNSIIPDVHHFLIGLSKYNDNSINRYSDDYYRASLIKALAGTIVPNDNRDVASLGPDSLSSDMKDLLYEFTLALNMDILKPSFGRVVGISALQAIYQMQHANHIPLDPKIFRMFAQPKIYTPLRIAALTFLVDMVHRHKSPFSNDLVKELIDMSISDAEPAVRYHIACQLVQKPPLYAVVGSDNGSSSELATKIWRLIIDSKMEPRLQGYYIDFWFTLYGSSAPTAAKIGSDNEGIRNASAHKNFHLTSAKRTPDDLLSTWHGTLIEIDEPDSPVNRLSAEMNEDMLQ